MKDYLLFVVINLKIIDLMYFMHLIVHFIIIVYFILDFHFLVKSANNHYLIIIKLLIKIIISLLFR